jgi:pyridoxal phosphate enzyme (YggS family)
MRAARPVSGPVVPTADEIRERHARLLARLRTVAEGTGLDPDRLRIVAVTKSWPVEVARAAVNAGLTLLGESRVQEAEPKIDDLPTAEWHLVGRLQSNKARRAVRGFEVIHSVDSAGLLDQLARVAAEEDRTPRLLLQVNVTGEAAKGGMTPEALMAMAGDLAGRRVVGLMTIARMGAGDEDARATFRTLRELRDRAREASGEPLDELSMGMSDDAEAAAAEGATLVRIGTALFGPRT